MIVVWCGVFDSFNVTLLFLFQDIIHSTTHVLTHKISIAALLDMCHAQLYCKSAINNSSGRGRTDKPPNVSTEPIHFT